MNFKNTFTKQITIIAIVTIIVIAAFLLIQRSTVKDEQFAVPTVPEHVWTVKSVDTMKSSRDLALNKRDDPNFETVVDIQTQNIANMGANYIGIGTPYDREFVPMLRLWVSAARRHNLRVWFRGNLAGWEGWFGYRRDLTREEHIAKVREFISANPDLFVDGDIFTPCPECENGGPGDPRSGTSVEDFRKFMILERRAVDEEFAKIGKNILTNYNSMNLDVAKVVFDQPTVEAMDNLVVVDHYVADPKDLVSHIDDLSKAKQAKIVLGEIGVPVKNITGEMTEDEQVVWLEEALSGISKNRNVIGLNWWVSVGGETALFKNNGQPIKAKSTLEKYFKLSDLSGVN